jgi:hypothetical protein
MTEFKPRREKQPACGLFHITRRHFGLLGFGGSTLERGFHATFSEQPERRRSAHLPSVDLRILSFLSDYHHCRGYPDIHEPASRRAQSIERSSGGALEKLIDVYRRPDRSHQTRRQALGPAGPFFLNNIHFFGNSAMIKPSIRLLMLTAMLAPGPALAAAEQDHVQFCWAMGKFDHTIYYAEIENREDRQASFDSLLEISGIDHHAVSCTISAPATHHPARAALFKTWRESEFEIVNTTFLSDLDY